MKTRWISWFSSFGYTIGCVSLYLIALWIFCISICRIIFQLYLDPFTIYNILDEVALVVFGVALVDITKYLLLEEVFQCKIQHQEYDTFTKFVIIIVTALCLEGLVLTIEFVKNSSHTFVYPVTLFASATLLLLGLGVYKKLIK